MATTETTTTEAPARPTAIDIARQRLAFQAELIDAIELASAELDNVDEMNPYSFGLWTYHEPNRVAGLSDEVRRNQALEWLRSHARLIQRVARLMGADATLDKSASDTDYRVSLTIHRDRYAKQTLVAAVPSSLTCEMVPTGEVHHIEAHDVPVMERRCPQSIFAGLDAEVTL